MTDVCLQNDTIIAGNLTFSLFSRAYNSNLSCGPSTYLRPEKGGAIIPWPYLVVLVFVHAPVLWQRITHWENVQMVALALALFSIVTTVISYWSTLLAADQILVWMPLQLLLDNGAMSQLYLLISAKDRKCGSVWGTVRKTQKPWNLLRRPKEKLPRNALKQRKKQQRAWVAVLACIMFVAMLILQIFGFAYTIKGLADHYYAKDLTVPWCSPFLQNYVVAIYDRGIIDTDDNCSNFQNPKMDSNKGIGCLNLKAKRQMDFLWVTVVILPMCIILEIVDFWWLSNAIPRPSGGNQESSGENVALANIPGNENPGEDDDEEAGVGQEEVEGDGEDNEEEEEEFDARPWSTMAVGFIILISLTVISGYHSMHLPDGISRSIWVFRHDPSTDSYGACVGQLHPSGTRGSVLAWSDGLFDFMKQLYMGG